MSLVIFRIADDTLEGMSAPETWGEQARVWDGPGGVIARFRLLELAAFGPEASRVLSR